MWFYESGARLNRSSNAPPRANTRSFVMKVIMTKKTPLELAFALGGPPQTGQAEQKKEELLSAPLLENKEQKCCSVQ